MNSTFFAFAFEIESTRVYSIHLPLAGLGFLPGAGGGRGCCIVICDL